MRVFLGALAIVGTMFFAVPAFAAAINVNVATAAQLQTVKGIGPKTAEAIIAYREAHGDFSNLSSLTGVKGIGKKKLKKIQDALTIEKKK